MVWASRELVDWKRRVPIEWQEEDKVQGPSGDVIADITGEKSIIAQYITTMFVYGIFGEAFRYFPFVLIFDSHEKVSALR